MNEVLGHRDGILDLHVESFLSRLGWSEQRSGSAGSLWTSPVSQPWLLDPDSTTLAIPHSLTRESFEFASLISRLSAWANQPVDDLQEQVLQEFSDLQIFKIGDPYLFEGSALLDDVVEITSNAKKLLRASGTTSRKSKAVIGSNYSKHGDTLASRALFNHTKVGSFLLPMEMPVHPAAPNDDELDTIGHVLIEPGERALTRTAAYALKALYSVIVEPSAEPSEQEVLALIHNGVSAEIVKAVRNIAARSSTKSMDVTFRWAPAIGTVDNVPTRIQVPSEASPLLTRAAKILEKSKPPSEASLSGQIVGIRFAHSDPFGEITVRTERANRTVEITVVIPGATAKASYDWARDHRPVFVSGTEVRAPGKPIRIDNPTKVVPVDDLLNGSGFE